MGTYTGTALNDEIFPDRVSAGVICSPPGSRPSIAADTINGLGGNDYLQGGGGADTINGGTGNDSIGCWIDTDEVGRATLTGTARFYGGSGNDILYADFYGSDIDLSQATFLLYGGTGNDVIRAAMHFPDEVTGQYGAATDILYGGAGNDTFIVQESSDRVVEKPGEGYDTIQVYNSDYVLPDNVERLLMEINGGVTGRHGTGNALDNVIKGTIWGGDVLDGGAGNDMIYGSVQSSYGGDTIHGGLGDDVIYSQDPQYGWNDCSCQDTFFGDAGNDRIFGGHDNDWIDGGTGNDTLYGQTDNDTVHGSAGNDLIYGGGGDSDTEDGDDSLYGDDGNDRIFGSFGNDFMDGGTGNDEMGGQAGNDTMYGGAGRDRLGGGSGNDRLYGDADADVLTGREGLDQLRGGAGNDIFDYDAVTDSRPGTANRDVIYDFTGVGAAAGDRIDLATIDANATKYGDQAFVFRGTGAFTGAGQVHVIASGGDTLIQANTGGTLAPELEILVKDGTALPGQWVAGDFIL